jgi:hypothetical protein
MNKVAFCQNLEVVANKLDELGLHKEADLCTQDMKKIASGQMQIREAGLFGLKLPNVGKMLGLGNLEKSLRPLYKPLLIGAAIYYGGPQLLKALKMDPKILSNRQLFNQKLTQLFGKQGAAIATNIANDVKNKMQQKAIQLGAQAASGVANQQAASVDPTRGAQQPGQPSQPQAYPNMYLDVQQVVNQYLYNKSQTPQQIQGLINTKKQTIINYMTGTIKATQQIAQQQAQLFDTLVKSQLRTNGLKI